MERFSNILLLADAGLENSIALKRALALANSNQASLTLIDVVGSSPDEMQLAITTVTPGELVDIAVTENLDQLEKVVAAGKTSGIDIKANVLVGKPFLEIIRQVLRNKHDLVIKCVDSTESFRNTLFGSTDMHLMRKCPCPVWIVKSTEHEQHRRIMAAVDQAPGNEVKDVLNRQILEMSTSLALAEFSELHIVHAWTLYGESQLRSQRIPISEVEVDAMVAEEASERRRWLKDLVRTYSGRADNDAVDYVGPQLHVIKGDAKRVVPEAAHQLDVDLIIMGTVARAGIPGFFMGNTAESILNQIDCSVLTIKPPGFVSPVSL
jgi:nucleotide-binding universal stress UspA family protein